MSKKFIGVMTGTSADALDGCIVSFDDQFQLIGRISLDLEKSYKKDYEECLMAGYKTIDESKKLSELENILNNQTVELVETLLDKKRLKQNDIAAIGFSGQTIFHTRQRSYQIGNPQKISDSL